MDEIAAWVRRQAKADLAAARIISDGGFEPERWDTDPPQRVNPAVDPGSAGVSLAIGQDPEYSCGWVPIRAWDHVIGQPPDARPAPGAVPVLAEVGRREFDHVIRHDPRTEAARAESVLAVLDLYERQAAKSGESALQEAPGRVAGEVEAVTPRKVVRVSLEVTYDDGAVMTFAADDPQRVELDIGARPVPWILTAPELLRLEPPRVYRTSISFEASLQSPATVGIRQALTAADEENETTGE